MEVQETRSSKGKPLFFINSNLFEIEKKVQESIYYRCVRNRTGGCSARAIVCRNPDVIVKRTSGFHDHEPEDSVFLKLKVLERMKSAVLEAPEKGVEVAFSTTAISVVSDLQNR